MGILKLAVMGVAGVVAYKAWQRRQAGNGREAARDAGDTTPPHGDPMLAGAAPSMAPGPDVSSAQSSRGFGEEP